MKKPVTWPLSLMAVSVTEAAPEMVVKVAWLSGSRTRSRGRCQSESISKPTATSVVDPEQLGHRRAGRAGARGQGHVDLGEAAPVVERVPAVVGVGAGVGGGLEADLGRAVVEPGDLGLVRAGEVLDPVAVLAVVGQQVVALVRMPATPEPK